ncbi:MULTISPECIES: gamma-mobile-trio protein GmtX [Pseudomonas]|jgi:hypothetical protein|uniref:Gamma-mobile-trio protein GmtX n=1 Tax=Pseudomonas asiatica TaxID=2219225 RepID=A0AAJ5HWE4_9PSED|nr:MULTISPECIES: gamma-mobile-trio protein GmtX [Pseudomonas]ELL4385195.1 hypothetical protein [Pseudomonas aeruginosa]MCG3645612.1 hypothetical protein [Pseudomonas putida]MCO8262759.1 gamma-mobile-trio protein GmtX [Pseudomonas asiatica]MCV6226739.1 gamma-mobile-trio protein GmtX [Pseudomonas aeruginosa]MCV6392660.1 gamma-mobile-trio protein GmtX [Pseudomonas aeruginosa]
MTPSETLSKLKKNCSLKKQHTLDAVYEVCNEMLSNGEKNFSFSAIARLGIDCGVPNAQSMRNSSGQAYRVLIQAFKEAAGPAHHDRAPSDWIDAIKDGKAKFLARAQEAENHRLRRLLREITPPNLEIRVDDRTPFSSENKLSEIERRALLYLMSEEFRLQWGCTLGKHGDLIDKKGAKVFRPGTLDAIQKALRAL